MTEYIANMLTKNMYMDGLIEESDEDKTDDPYEVWTGKKLLFEFTHRSPPPFHRKIPAYA